MLCRNFMLVPMHARKVWPKYLHAVHSYIPRVVNRILCMYHGKCYKRSTVFRPAGYYREFGDISTLYDYLLALAPACYYFGHPVFASIRVHQDRKCIPCIFEQQCFSAAVAFTYSVRDFRYLEVRVYKGLNTDQFVFLFQYFDKFREIFVCHVTCKGNPRLTKFEKQDRNISIA